MRAFRKLLVALMALVLVVPAARGQDADPITAEDVQRAIREGREYLLNEMSPRGTWDDMGQYPGGVSALCTLALLNAGVPPSHPKIRKALETLRGMQLSQTYTVSLQTMALCAGEPARDRLLIQQNADWLQRVQIADGERAGSWTYGEGIGGDNSNSQFAVLALHEAERVGARIKPQTWSLAADYWKRCQRPDGSWGYQPGFPGTGSMTCAGIGAWVICSGKIAEPSASFQNGVVQCCQSTTPDDVIERAVVWMGRNFSVRRNPGGGAGWHYYYLYGLERAGRLTARRLIGEHDWYREGAELLVAEQDPFGHYWQSQHYAEDKPHVATSLALLFLSKGRWPVLVGKVKHGPGDDWNNHVSDVANITALAEREWGLNLTWQVVDPQPSSVDSLLQTPVLYISGSQPPELAGAEQKIRSYLDRGGFIFAEACCADGSGFDRGFRQFLDGVFPEPEYKLRQAGPEHPIWRIDKLVRVESPYVGRLWTVEYGCRTCVVFSEVDLSCYWELQGRGRDADLPDAVKSRIDDATAIGLNVLAYATNREPKSKEASFASVDAAESDVLGARGVIRVAKIVHGGGANDAPGALANLLRAAAQGELKLQVSVVQTDVSPASPQLARFHLAFMHGRHDFRFSPEEREGLREYLVNGGTLMADAICASQAFADAFRRELQLVLPDAKLARVPADHPLFTDAAGGFNIQQVSRREPAVAAAGQPLRARIQQGPPELEAIEIDGRLAVIFSPYDISCALEQHEALQCRGYTREDAARIGLNVLMYSLSPDAGAVAPAP